MRCQRLVAGLLLAVLVFLPGCGTSFPADPEGTLEKVQGGTLRVGVSPHPDRVRITASGSGSDVRNDAVQGDDADLVKRFATHLGAGIEWKQGTEQVLAEELKHGGLDLVIGGLDDKTPWVTHAGLTRPYAESRDQRGDLHKHVMLVPLGENAFLLELDKFLMEAKEQQ